MHPPIHSHKHTHIYAHKHAHIRTYLQTSKVSSQFGIALQDLVPANTVKVPTILEKCLQHIEAHGKYTAYCIAGSFRGGKLSQVGEKYDFRGENFRGLLFLFHAKGCHAPKFCGENFHEYPQNLEIRESFLLRKFSTIQ